jgi:hypothetical protein
MNATLDDFDLRVLWRRAKITGIAVLAVLVIAGVAMAHQPPLSQQPTWMTLGAGLSTVEPTHLMIGGDDVSINLKTGEVKFGPNYNADDTARTFWQAMGKRMPKDCSIKSEETK